MLRLDPGEGRIHSARQFQVWEGGGEYNVARGLRRCFGLRTALVSAFADNPVGRLLEDCILQLRQRQRLLTKEQRQGLWVHLEVAREPDPQLQRDQERLLEELQHMGLAGVEVIL